MDKPIKSTDEQPVAAPVIPPHAYYVPGDHGGFIPGVPARDLTKDEWLALDKETRDLCRATGLYTLTKEHADG